MKNWRKTVGIEEKLDLISRFEKSEWIEMRASLVVAYVRTIRDNADRIKESAT